MLILSYRTHQDISCMGHVVDHSPNQTILHHTTTDEETINHIAHVNAWNDTTTNPYTHLVIYEQDAPDGALNQSNIKNLDLNDTPNHIPTHLHHAIQERQTEYKKQYTLFQTQQTQLENQARTQAQHEQDLQTYEQLRKKLGK